MVASKFLIAAFVATASASALNAEEDLFASLLKRQEPGSASYNCHDNCGTAITLSKRPNPCDSDAFKTNYNNCLQCAGPDNFNIWRMYGNTLSAAGATCGLETQPKSGKQPDVGPAVHVGGSSSAAPAASTPAASAAPVSGSDSPASATPAPTSAPAAGATSALVSTPVLSPSVSAAPSRSANSTASFTSSGPAQQSTNAAANLGASDAAGVFGAIFIGAMLGL
ncbi:hypothetical protein BKA66DRAFT_447332 [Pyrenochaeta sp. MPI-SDFR-AT-0127]|nr:hypothetical protein BKA66DRAFT_447332 [Pyrenochaeta sp. MPI-SDFR-AT-0127]